MICPKCGFEQPESPECMRCGVIVGRYRGAAWRRPPPPRAAGVAVASPVFAAPAPALAGGGTVYGGPAPGGGTVYQGPPPGSPAAGSRRGAGAFAPVFTSPRSCGWGRP